MYPLRVAPTPLLCERLQRDRGSAAHRSPLDCALFRWCCLVPCMFSMVGLSHDTFQWLDKKAKSFVCSCHVSWNISPSVASFGNRLDICGIVLLMWGASLPSIHFAFWCDSALKIAHWCFVCLSVERCRLRASSIPVPS